MAMTSFERVTNTLALKPVDEIPMAVSPWAATIERWTTQGHLKKDEDIVEPAVVEIFANAEV